MLDLIRRIPLCLRLLFTPGTGRRRADARLTLVPALSPAPASAEWAEPSPLPAHRSPYGLAEHFDGATAVAVRPYLAAHEQRQRRRELAMATLGLDMPGPYWIHGMEVA
ncbi:hypothetical protein [Streptomyces adelaidensis]|uniref:hypothetical protein n=1 Tax=Streptomyces adelaidensis TaxID=2796465 RepID=UPI001907E415|nr:hypothetical protein [Streptomyces adelaidensis]